MCNLYDDGVKLLVIIVLLALSITTYIVFFMIKRRFCVMVLIDWLIVLLCVSLLWLFIYFVAMVFIWLGYVKC